jgi:tetratricopeptide (TPR) repeat protein
MLAIGQAEAASKESVLNALAGVASQVRGKVGESLASLEKYDFPLDTTTKSLEALKAFSMGQRALRESGEVEAIPFFRQAIQLDPDFALAYTTLGRAYEDLGEDKEAVEDFTKAYNLRNRLSERERYNITTLYSETVTGDMEGAKQAGELWIRAYPRDGVAREKLATVFGDLGEWENANAQAEKALRLDPDSTINVSNSVTTAVALNRMDEAQRILEAAKARGLDGPVIHEIIYPLAFLRGDRAEMERQVAWAVAQGDTEYLLYSEHSDTEAYYGRLHKARDFSQRAIESATRQESKEAAALCEIVAAFREMETGNAALASKGVRAALSLAPSRDVKVLAALVLSKSDEPARAKALARELESQNPFNTLIKSYWLPTLKASIEVHAGNPQAALSLLQIAAPYELSQISVSTAPMYPAYIRGEAYLLEHNGSAAAAEFKKLVDYRGIVQNSILGALSVLQLARAEVMMGDLDGARKQYRDFLSLWKEADPDVPLLKQALAEYAKL